MAVVIAVVLVVSLLASAMAFRSVGSAFIAGGRQSGASAVSQADAGLADALYRIDQGSGGTGGSTSFCVKAGNENCLAGSVPAAPGVSYVASQLSSTDWVVDSLATVNGQTAAVEGHVTQQPAYPFALFGNESLQFAGSTPPAFSTYSSSAPAGAGNPDTSAPVTVASNGRITCSGAFSGKATVEYFAGGGVTSTGSAGSAPCGTYQSSATRYYVPAVDPPASASACPGGGLGGGYFGSGNAGAPTSLAAGTYLCTSPLNISGYLKVLGPIQIYVVLDQSLYGTGTAAITIAPGSYVNDQADYCAGGGSDSCGGSITLAPSRNLEIFTDDPGEIGHSSGAGFYLGALLYAPKAFLTGDACASHYYGAVVVGGVSCNGGQMTVSYDTALGNLRGPWTAGSYVESQPSTFKNAMTAAGF